MSSKTPVHKVSSHNANKSSHGKTVRVIRQTPQSASVPDSKLKKAIDRAIAKRLTAANH